MYIQHTTIRRSPTGGYRPPTTTYHTPSGTPITIPSINNRGGYYSPPNAVAQRNATRQKKNAKQHTLQKTISNPGGPPSYPQGTGISSISLPKFTGFDWFVIAGVVILIIAVIALVAA